MRCKYLYLLTFNLIRRLSYQHIPISLLHVDELTNEILTLVTRTWKTTTLRKSPSYRWLNFKFNYNLYYVHESFMHECVCITAHIPLYLCIDNLVTLVILGSSRSHCNKKKYFLVKSETLLITNTLLFNWISGLEHGG